MNLDALLNTLGTRCRTIPLAILYVTEGCNLTCITCAYRTPAPEELTLSDISHLADALKNFGLRHIVFSGGEPLQRRDFPEICTVFHNHGVRQTLLTNGMLLEKRLHEIQPFLAEIIVSLDGPDEQTHNGIRGANSFRQISRGIRAVHMSPGRPALSIRTVIQKRNFRSLIGMVRCARSLGVDRISFLAADMHPGSFGRKGTVNPSHAEGVVLSEPETQEFRTVVGQMASECEEEFRTGFISESPAGLMRIVQYYEAMTGKAPFPPTACNAPMISTVITATGELLPCFFLPPFAHLQDAPLADLMNNPAIRSTRADVRAGVPDRCRTCVCTLQVGPSAALLDRF